MQRSISDTDKGPNRPIRYFKVSKQPEQANLGLQGSRPKDILIMSTTLDFRPPTGQTARPAIFPMLEIHPTKSLSNTVSPSKTESPSKTGRVAWNRPYAWSTIIPSVRRQESIEGALIGCAIGESIGGLGRSKQARLRSELCSKPPGQIDPGTLVASHRTEGMLVSVQAVLLSQAMSENFQSHLSERLAWYQRLQPTAYLGGFVNSLLGRSQSTAKLGDDPLVRALALSVLMQGHHDGALSWVEDSTQLTFGNRWVIQASFLIATAAQVAQFHRTPHQISTANLLKDLRSATGSQEIQQRLDALIEAQEADETADSASRILGCKEHRWQDHLVDNALLAIYTFARHPDAIHKGLAELLELRGNLQGVLSLYAGLATVQSGVQGLPGLWPDRLSLYPYSSTWVQQYTDRCVDWPHGPEDIQATRCLPSHPVGQFVRNLCRGFA